MKKITLSRQARPGGIRRVRRNMKSALKRYEQQGNTGKAKRQREAIAEFDASLERAAECGAWAIDLIDAVLAADENIRAAGQTR
jgi:hypothetical protein